MPRRSGFGSRSSPSVSRAPPRATSPPPRAAPPPPPQRAAPTQAAPAPAPAPSAVSTPAAAPQKGGMMRDIATTAAGVAGGHLAANAIMGMFSGSKSEEPAPAPAAPQETQPYQQQYQQPYQPSPYQAQPPQQGGPCAVQLQDFINCAQNNYDISLCSGFNQALKDCKLQNPGA